MDTKPIHIGSAQFNILSAPPPRPKAYTPTLASIFDAPQVQIQPGFIPFVYFQSKITDCGPEHLQQDGNFLFPGFVGSPKFTAKETRLLDKYGPYDGTDFSHLAQASLNSGFCALSLMPDDAATDTPQDYWSSNGITREIAISAATRKPTGWAQLPRIPTWQEIQTILQKRHMVSAVIALGNRFYQDEHGMGTWDPNRLFPLQFGTLVGYHWIKLLSQDLVKLYGVTNPNPNYTYFVNSWSAQYGQRGIGWFDSTYVPHIIELDILI